MKGFSWIIFSIGVFFLLLCFYVFNDESPFWTDFYYLMSAYVCIIGLTFNYKKNKTTTEMAFITFFLIYRVLLLMYFVVFKMILDMTDFMNSNIVFLIFFGVSAFLAFIYNKKYGTED